MTDDSTKAGEPFDAASTGALAHLYRGELYRSTIWRTRLDTTTNWAVVTTGLALSLAYSSPTASPLPLALVGLLVALFLILEARRYRYFDTWRLRVRVLENHFFGPILLGRSPSSDGQWASVLCADLRQPSLHIGMMAAAGRRLRRNYGWIFLIQVSAYLGKLLIHPTTVGSFEELWQRATIGPIPGQAVLAAGLLFHGSWVLVALLTRQTRREPVEGWRRADGPDPMLELSTKG